MAAFLTCAVVASLAGLIMPPVLRILSLGRTQRMELKSFRSAFAPE
ncbi:hypothetical protein [Microvirga sp. ACRRW]|nr:hypothetical protein [Microvirga sp. ACRRW]